MVMPLKVACQFDKGGSLMRKELFVAYSVVLLCFGQFVNVPDACASQTGADYYAQRESDGRRNFGSADLDGLYPIDANSPEWEELITEEERFEKTQIDSAVIKEMDTDTLLEAALRSPMLYTVEDACDSEIGAMAFLEKMNAGRELLERGDVKDAVVNKYLSLEIPEKTLNDYSEIDNPSDGDLNGAIMRLLEDEEFTKNLDRDIAPYYRTHFLEGIILSDKIYPALSVEDKKKLYDKSLVLNKQKEKSSVFSYCAEDSFTISLMEDSALVERILFPRRKGDVTAKAVDLFAPGEKEVEAVKIFGLPFP